ncbi:MAG: dynamin family protein [Desulfobacterales bacterium]|nr:dynamin family protein [Desulfobacterales bacterium]
MDGYGIQKQRLLALNDGLRSLFRSANAIPGLNDYRFGEWEPTCEGLPRQLNEETIRVAVVGAIKSGKSTFLNSLLQGDFLKRGAGVVTSIVTRVRAGERLRATLFFKTWAEVNADMQQALVFFPDLNWRSAQEHFDIRREPERTGLRRSLQGVNGEQGITDDARDRNLVLLSCYLDGYETVHRFLGEEPVVHRYDNGRFNDHWAYTGNESLSVYLQDIQLDIRSDNLGSNIEIADCQGSDSSNPLHLAMVQDYLRIAHLLVYVISSRTGLRQADIKFLSMIKRMGILDNCLFVLNCDFSEHQAVDDLKASVRRVSAELALLKPAAGLFAFSALFNLFQSLRDELPARDQRRLDLWRADADLVAFSDRETARFATVLGAMLSRQRHALLFQNPIERLGVIRTGMANWISVNREILTRGAADAHRAAERIRRHQERFTQILSALQSSLAGIVPKLRQSVGGEVNRFLDPSSGEVIRALTAFISACRFAPERYTATLHAGGFSQALYQMFQDFKQSLDAFITEQVNPDVIRFIALQEGKICEQLEAIAAPYKSLIEDASVEFDRLMEDLGIPIDKRGAEALAVPGLASLLHHTGVSHPPLVSSMNYTARLRTEAILRRGFYRVVSGFKKVLKKPVRAGEEDARALKECFVLIQRETRQSLGFQLRDFQENLKFKYLFVMIETASERLAQAVAERLQAYAADFGALARGVSARREDKERAAAVLAAMSEDCRRLQAQIDAFKTAMTPSPAAGG